MPSKRYRLKLATWIVIREAEDPSLRKINTLRIRHAWRENWYMPVMMIANISGWCCSTPNIGI
jgi:hypothetical protein